ncbi:NADP-binding protein [Pseudoalteromonas sp. R3]|uniref:NADP-binding protein n=1 Tax=Pseudoalteromonas sp. R3 TaxID=1709477 RepID=UPI0006B46105|nr:NADP-binding protein [Pseudoalteromonas sp. R3]AZZ96709.1 NADP-binding protein [Pseudoalteromonas sp. R3]
MFNRLVVAGAGWLGMPTAQAAACAGWQVQATRRQPHDDALSRQLVHNGDALIHDVSLQQAFWLCAMPPGARREDSNYLLTLEATLALASELEMQGFLLCSSTGVYAEADGVYTEHGALAAMDSQRQRILQQAEQLVLERGGKVLRLAGLVGPGREPGQFIAGKALRSASQERVNMVHRDDVISAIMAVFTNWPKAQSVYNVCAPEHPVKQAYYQAHCERSGTTPPSFASDDSKERIIDGAMLGELGFSYQHAI